MRLVSLITYFVFFIIHKISFKRKIVFSIFTLLLIVDSLNLYFETPIVSKLIYIIRIIVYALLIASIFNKLKLEKLNPVVFMMFLMVFLLNIFLVFFLAESASKSLNDIIEYNLIIIYGLALITSLVLAFNYNLRYDTFRSGYFFNIILAFLFSDLAWFLAYHLDTPKLFFLDLLFYLLGLYFLLKYALFSKEEIVM